MITLCALSIIKLAKVITVVFRIETFAYLPKSMSRVANLALSFPMTHSQTDVQAILSIADDPAEMFCRFYSQSSDVLVVSANSCLLWKWLLLTEKNCPLELSSPI